MPEDPEKARERKRRHRLNNDLTSTTVSHFTLDMLAEMRQRMGETALHRIIEAAVAQAYLSPDALWNDPNHAGIRQNLRAEAFHTLRKRQAKQKELMTKAARRTAASVSGPPLAGRVRVCYCFSATANARDT